MKDNEIKKAIEILSRSKAYEYKSKMLYMAGASHMEGKPFGSLYQWVDETDSVIEMYDRMISNLNVMINRLGDVEPDIINSIDQTIEVIRKKKRIEEEVSNEFWNLGLDDYDI